VETEHAGRAVYTARAPRPSSPGTAFHPKRLKRFARKGTGFTGLLFQGWGAPASHHPCPERGPWVVGGEQEPAPDPMTVQTTHVCSCFASFWSSLPPDLGSKSLLPSRKETPPLFLLSFTDIKGNLSFRAKILLGSCVEACGRGEQGWEEGTAPV